MTTLGNISLLNQPKHGFICSRCTQSSVILPCLDWAVEQSQKDVPIMSTFHSEMEQAVFDMLVEGKCPLILVLGRSIYKVVPEKLKPLLQANRLLIISLSEQQRISRESAYECNKYICEHSASLTFGYLSPDSRLNTLSQEAMRNNKTVKFIK